MGASAGRGTDRPAPPVPARALFIEGCQFSPPNPLYHKDNPHYKDHLDNYGDVRLGSGRWYVDCENNNGTAHFRTEGGHVIITGPPIDEPQMRRWRLHPNTTFAKRILPVVLMQQVHNSETTYKTMRRFTIGPQSIGRASMQAPSPGEDWISEMDIGQGGNGSFRIKVRGTAHHGGAIQVVLQGKKTKTSQDNNYEVVLYEGAVKNYWIFEAECTNETNDGNFRAYTTQKSHGAEIQIAKIPSFSLSRDHEIVVLVRGKATSSDGGMGVEQFMFERF